MEEIEKKSVEETTIVPASGTEETQTDKTDAPADPVTVEPEKTEGIDYKKELEEVKTKQPARTPLEKAMYKRKQIDDEIVKLGGTSEPAPVITPAEDIIDDDVQPVLKKDLKKIIQTEMAPLISGSKIASKVKEVASSDEEAALITWHLQNSITPSGNLDEDVENAQLLANKKGLKAKISEVRQAAISNKHKTSGGGSGAKPRAGIPRPKLSTEEEGAIKMANLHWDETKGAWV